ncbi:ribonuclease J [Candidatus Vampirococcus lugosii]|uniref:Ribonuclease J n=1 Tax=Candidatus Vampirococcus lugosii TaxID=2789015 RepID=A0ABS5QMN7_9BACT|nr:ribonuclease J [Candidatus Vampirococcus lugosii]MBS8122337.1 ribonuclease J [Candidatus Vampirococcus lugosii]
MGEISPNSNVNINLKKNINVEKKNNIKVSTKVKKKEFPVRIGSLLGLEQVGQCIFIEYKDDIIIVDAGMEFAADEILGADYLIPDITYLKKNKNKIKGVVLTHGHLDHIGALRHILPELDYPTVYTTPLTLGIVKKTFNNASDANKVKSKIVNPDSDIIKLGCFSIEFVPVNHNIPETLALAIHTPKGLIFNSADFKIDYTPAIDKPADLGKIARIGLEGVRLYIGDSLGSERKGWAISEKVIGENLENIIKNARSRIILATFASNIGRIIQIIQNAIKYDKVIFLEGRSMINNVEICQKLGYLDVPRGCIRKLSADVDNMPPDRVVILSTGAQGEEFSGLARISRGDHTSFKLRRDDTVLMSASTIPGNEQSVGKMLNHLVVQDINLITNSELDIHASGHGYQEDHKLMLNLIKPDYFMPFYTDARLRYNHKKIALDMGMQEKNILMPALNGSVIEMYDDEILISKEKIELDTVMVDGKGIGHLSGEYVMKARKIMSENGIFALIFKIDSINKELVGNIQIESRGFVYSSEVKKIHTNVVEFAKKRYYELLKRKMSTKEILKSIKDDLGTYLFKILGRSPMIMPMFVYINRDVSGNYDDDIDAEDSLVGMTLEEQGGDYK